MAIDCLDCKIVVSDTSGFLGGAITFTDPVTGLSQAVSHPDFEPGQLAKYDNFFFIKCPDGHGGDHIKKFEILDENCLIEQVDPIFISVIPGVATPFGISYTGNGMCAKNDTTLIIGSVTSSIGSNWIYEIDITGNLANPTPLFQTNGFVNGDIVYLPSFGASGSIVATIDTGPGVTSIIHYDMTGNILGQSTFNLAGTNPESMFSKNNDVYICTDNNIFQFDLTSYTLIPANLTNPAGLGIDDAASSPNECDEGKFCYKIGDITDPINGGAGGIVFALPFTGLNQTPYYYEVALDDLATGTTPIDTITTDDIAPFSQLISLNGEKQCGKEGIDPQGNYIYKPWDPSGLGAEFGSYNTDYTLPTSTDFGTGDINTFNILNQPAVPTFPTHDIAAYLCENYILNGVKGWFLPSLMEFHLLATNLGPGTPFENDLNLNTHFEKLQNTYWTSSEVNGFIQNPVASVTFGLPTIGGADDFKSWPFSWGYTAEDTTPPYNAFSLIPGPHVFARCNTLSVRAIRKFECIEPEIPAEVPFNWVDDVQFQPMGYTQNNAKSTGIGLAGAAASNWSRTMITGPDKNNISQDPSTWITHEYEFDAVIGLEEFRIRLNLVDVAGNEYHITDFLDSLNPEGYTFKMWTADKIFLGEWHYQNCEILSTLPIDNIFKSNTFNWQGASWFDQKVFTDSVRLRFTNPTLVSGNYPIVAYGFYDSEWGPDEVRARKVDNSVTGCTSWIYTVPNPNTALGGYSRSHWKYLPDPKFHYVYENEYEEGTFQGTTGSYAFIHFSCKMADSKPLPLPDMNSADNTTVNGKNVICLKEPVNDVKQYPGQNILEPDTCGHIGTAWRHTRDYADCSPSGSSYLPFNTNIYSNYVLPGTSNVDLSYDTSINTSSNAALFPKHFLWTWHAVFDPNLFTNNLTPIYDNFLDGLDAACTHGCFYEIGDVGPAGGIICAVPYMNVNDTTNNIVGPVVPPLQGNVTLVNPTEFYFELSPVNLNAPSTSNYSNYPQWGSQDPINSIDIDVAFDPNYTGIWAFDSTIYDYTTPSGTTISLLDYPAGPLNASWEMEQVGQGKITHDAMIAVNNGNPVLVIPTNPANPAGDYYNAFEACENYTLNSFDDWFLPNVREMEFARSYTPQGTLYNSLGSATQSITWNTGSSETSYWTSNTSKGNPDSWWWSVAGAGNLFPMTAAQTTFHENSGGTAFVGGTGNNTQFIQWDPAIPGLQYLFGYIVASDPLVETNPISSPIGPGWRSPSTRFNRHNVRAMRRFTCPTPSIIGSDKHTWSFCGFKDVNGQIGYFSTPWVANAMYDQGPIMMDHIGSNTSGDDFVADIHNWMGSPTTGVYIQPGEVIGVTFSPPIQMGAQSISVLYIEYSGLLTWDESFSVTGLLAAPVTNVTYTLYNNCGSALGVSITDPDDTNTARLSAPPITTTSKLQSNQEDISEKQTEENKNIITKDKENDKRTY